VRHLRATVGQLKWQLGLARAAIEEAAGAIAAQLAPEPDKEQDQDDAVLAVLRQTQSAPGSRRAPSPTADDGGAGAGAGGGEARPKRLRESTSLDRLGVTPERTPWLRTPDGVPVRIDWLVLAPRVGAVVGGWWLLGRLVGRLLG